MGIALEPEADYEKRSDGGGCEDPRITFVEPLRRYLMTYTAFSDRGPRIALASSKDLFHWQRMGLATFGPYNNLQFSDVDDKDASLFPIAIPNPSGQPELALIHRPLFPGTRPEETACHAAKRELDIDRESIWISYSPMSLGGPEPGGAWPLYIPPPFSNAGFSLGAAKNWRRHAADSHAPRLADHLPRSQ